MEILWWTYLATLYGTILWIAIQFVIEKDKFDEGGEGFDVKLYAKKNWDNWANETTSVTGEAMSTGNDLTFTPASLGGNRVIAKSVVVKVNGTPVGYGQWGGTITGPLQNGLAMRPILQVLV